MRPLSAEALLAGVVDYAGLFPPAALSMAEAVAEDQAAQAGAEAWMGSLVGFGSCSFREPAAEFAALAARPSHD